MKKDAEVTGKHRVTNLMWNKSKPSATVTKKVPPQVMIRPGKKSGTFVNKRLK